MLARSRATTQDLASLHASLRITPYPYEHAEAKVTLTRYAVAAVPSPENVGDVYQAAEGTIDALYSLYMRIMSDLAQRAEAVEASLGLPPLPEPVEERARRWRGAVDDLMPRR